MKDFSELVGKTIVGAVKQRKKEYKDDTGFLRLSFSDGSYAVVMADYSDWNEDYEVEDEYATDIFLTERDDLVDIVDINKI